MMEFMSKITKKKPLMLRCQVKGFYKADYRLNTSKAKRELGFNPRPMKEALKDVFEYISKQHLNLSGSG